MGTKYLARTAIEGGRRNGQRIEEHYWTKSERLRWKGYLRELRYDHDLADEFEPENRTEPYYKEFTDKLTPIYHWLQSRVGRPWGDVYREMKQKFDTRTTAGRHIVYDHLLGVVAGVGQKEFGGWRTYDFSLNEDGLLVGTYWKFNNQRDRRRRRPKNVRIRVPRRRKWRRGQIEAFFQGRRIEYSDGVPHWMVPRTDTDQGSWRACVGPCFFSFAEHKQVVVEPVALVSPPRRSRLDRYKVMPGGTKTSQAPYRQLMHFIPYYGKGPDLTDGERLKLRTMIGTQRIMYCGSIYA